MSKELVNCLVCGKEFEMEIVMCCSGRECGCMGLPIDPIVCSKECYGIGLKPKKEQHLTAIDTKCKHKHRAWTGKPLYMLCLNCGERLEQL